MFFVGDWVSLVLLENDFVICILNFKNIYVFYREYYVVFKYLFERNKIKYGKVSCRKMFIVVVFRMWKVRSNFLLLRRR